MLTPDNFTCDKALELLDEYRRGALDPFLLVLVGEHLQQCESCSEELRLREAMADVLTRSLPAAEPPKTLPAAVRHAVDNLSPATAGRKPARMLPFMLSAAVVITIAVAVVQLRPPATIPVSTTIAATRDVRPQFAQEAAIPATASEPALAAPDEPTITPDEAPPPAQRFGARPPSALSRSAMPVAADLVETTTASLDAAGPTTGTAAGSTTGTATAPTTGPLSSAHTTSPLAP